MAKIKEREMGSPERRCARRRHGWNWPDLAGVRRTGDSCHRLDREKVKEQEENESNMMEGTRVVAMAQG